MLKKVQIYFIIFISIVIIATNIQAVMAGNKSTIYFEPINKEVVEGETFIIKVQVNPQGESLDTIRAEINFQPEYLNVINFSLGSLYPNSAPSNFIDNNKGQVSYGGVIFNGSNLKSGTFGVITLQAKKKGETTVSLTNDSKLIGAGSEKIDSTSLGSLKIIIHENNKITTEKNELQDLIVSSDTHPEQNQWYKDNNVKIKWQTELKATSYLYAFDQNVDTEPITKINETTKSFENVGNGIWYFHVKCKLADGEQSTTSHYRLMIDKDEPRPFILSLNKTEFSEEEKVELYFGTIDQTSGIEFYDMAFDGGSFIQQTSPYILQGLKTGDHAVIVRAIDRAGNVTSAIQKFHIFPEDKTRLEKWLGNNLKWIIVVAVAFVIGLLIFVKKKK